MYLKAMRDARYARSTITKSAISAIADMHTEIGLTTPTTAAEVKKAKEEGGGRKGGGGLN
jgi:hypothetical protein